MCPYFFSERFGMRQIQVWLFGIAFQLGILSSGFCQNCDPLVLACTKDNLIGDPDNYGDFATDLTYRAELKEVWIMESAFPGRLQKNRITILGEDLQTARDPLIPSIDVPVFGITEIPDQPELAGLYGNCFVLSPDIATEGNLKPAIGIMDDRGDLIQGGEFLPIIDPSTKRAPPGFFAALDAHPSSPELALLVLDYSFLTNGNVFFHSALYPAEILFVSAVPVQSEGGDLEYLVIEEREPIPVEGSPTFFGGGITYNGFDTVLAVAGFRSIFEAHLAMEYNIHSGAYTGRTAVLDHRSAPLNEPLIALGIDTGFVGAEEAIFLYNVYRDAVYAVPFDHAEAPGPVQKLNPFCNTESDGRVRLTWINNGDFNYDHIQVRENGVLVDILPGDATEYVSPNPVPGKYEFCLETVNDGGSTLNEIRVCCEGQNTELLIYDRVTVDPSIEEYHFQLGISSPPVVQNQGDLRIYVIGSYDNQVRVVNEKLQIFDTIETQPPEVSEVLNFELKDIAATGIALVDLEIQGQMVPMYLLLDGDGLGQNLIPRASVHFLEETVFSGSPEPIPAGTRYKEKITAIDFSGISDTGFFIRDWDSTGQVEHPPGDPDRNLFPLITVDSESRRIIKIVYDPEAHTLAAVAEAPLPMKDLAPHPTKVFPTGGISVLPSGYYLIAGGTVFDTTVVRAYLMTPFPPLDAPTGENGSPKFVGSVDGLYSFSQFQPLAGLALGERVNYGFDTTFFQRERTGAMLYDILHFRAAPDKAFEGNYLVGLTSPLTHPGLKAELLFDEPSTLGENLETLSLAPGFAGDEEIPAIDFHYSILNSSDFNKEIHLNIRVFLDDVEAPGLAETDIRIPAGQSHYRVARGRSDRAFRLRIENRGFPPEGNPPQVRLIIGATAVKEIPLPPEEFRRGDTDGDGLLSLTDVIKAIDYQFRGEGTLECFDAADVDDDGELSITDLIRSLTYQFVSSTDATIPAPPGPFNCGPDPDKGMNNDTFLPCIYPKCP